MDHLEGRVVLHGCCGGAAAAWGLPLLPLDVLWPRRAAGPSDWLPQSAALLLGRFLLVSYMPLGLRSLTAKKHKPQRKTPSSLGFESYLWIARCQRSDLPRKHRCASFCRGHKCQPSKREPPSTARALV